MTKTVKKRSLKEIYAEIPRMLCLTNCSYCCGPVKIGRRERININRYCREHGLPTSKVFGNPDEWEKDGKKGGCVYLRVGKCVIYPVRPVLCRIFGAVEQKEGEKANLVCPIGCRPMVDKITWEKALDLMHEAHK